MPSAHSYLYFKLLDNLVRSSYSLSIRSVSSKNYNSKIVYTSLLLIQTVVLKYTRRRCSTSLYVQNVVHIHCWYTNFNLCAIIFGIYSISILQ
ncbi:hypothetical protein LIPSTDRAFT_322408 [Lipomyces starkeyi NRRL Y-11557]|uniref:Uncharacterized protein n=1 Tax=Lipomyces starkeyi NRRL Y-11557 TaxID=675824 RepID=A0A1E3Q585_LIPST|nr:hypothetical protein LIPSTDRAFT_322408 [Lipomyces starkeyi NRRL Y-11557]